MPGSVFTPGDAILGWTTGTWGDISGISHTDIMCFTTGTKIVTKDGLVDVETLIPGDMVSTCDHGNQPVRWLSTTSVTATQQINDPEIRPILIRCGTLGPNSPCRDTWVSPQHRVVYSGWKAELYFGTTEVLVSAKALARIGIAERDDSLKAVTYVHVLFDGHEILTGDGLKSESLMPAEMARSTMTADQLAKIEKLDSQCPQSGERLAKLARPEVRVKEALVLA